MRFSFAVLIALVFSALAIARACADEPLLDDENDRITSPYYWPQKNPQPPIVTVDPLELVPYEPEARCIPANQDCEEPNDDE